MSDFLPVESGLNETSDSNEEAVAGGPSQVQSQAPLVEDMDKTDNVLAQRSVSLTSDDALLEERAVLRDSVASDDQEVLLELNTEEQEQFEVLDSADGEDDKSHESIGAEASQDLEEDASKKPEPSESPKSGSSSSGKKPRDISPIVFEKKEATRSDKKSSKSTKDRKEHSSGPHRIVDKLFSNTRYFIIKSNNFENVKIAKTQNVWSTPPYNEKKLNKAYRDCRNVMLIFSVRESGRFQGIAKLLSESRHDIQQVAWVLPPGISQSQLGGVFKLDWIHRGAVEFSVCMDLKNPWNDNKPVKISRDGQEVEPSIGERLCRLWEKVESDDDVLCGRSGSGRDHLKTHAGSGVPSGHASFSSRHGQQSMPYPNPAMYFPYTMPPSMFSSTGGGDARNRIGMPSHPYFTHLPRLGYSSANPPLPPPSLHHSDGGGGGHYPRLGRPWWTVPNFPPPSHLHHPHHSHPPPNESSPYSSEVQHPSTTAQEITETAPTPEVVHTSTTSSVPRTTSRNAYTQQRLSILKKHQQKEQASKKTLVNSALNSTIPDVVPKVKDLDYEEKGVQQIEARFGSKFLPSQ